MKRVLLSGVACCLLGGATIFAQPATNDNRYVTREEYEALLKRLEDADWFAAVGRPLPEEVQGSVVNVSSWEEGVTCYSSVEWEDFILDQQNLLTMHRHELARTVHYESTRPSRSFRLHTSCLARHPRAKSFRLSCTSTPELPKTGF